MKKNNGYLTSVILGYRDRYNEEIAKQQQSLYEYAFSKNYGENSFSNLVVRNDSPHKICELRFSNGLLQSIEWYIK